MHVCVCVCVCVYVRMYTHIQRDALQQEDGCHNGKRVCHHLSARLSGGGGGGGGGGIVVDVGALGPEYCCKRLYRLPDDTHICHRWIRDTSVAVGCETDGSQSDARHTCHRETRDTNVTVR